MQGVLPHSIDVAHAKGLPVTWGRGKELNHLPVYVCLCMFVHHHGVSATTQGKADAKKGKIYGKVGKKIIQ